MSRTGQVKKSFQLWKATGGPVAEQQTVRAYLPHELLPKPLRIDGGVAGVVNLHNTWQVVKQGWGRRVACSSTGVTTCTLPHDRWNLKYFTVVYMQGMQHSIL
jgi:hypothetical protein